VVADREEVEVVIMRYVVEEELLLAHGSQMLARPKKCVRVARCSGAAVASLPR
jgi:hypothetical protein